MSSSELERHKAEAAGELQSDADLLAAYRSNPSDPAARQLWFSRKYLRDRIERLQTKKLLS
ncbi:hypothetical protein [Aliiruegeria sabulilitoris]|uniref:hypothetical protein n=1 Tax=Aliiruegeria sabulilitoris TaxID=1510458 RepID=UPI00082BE0FC|nr:hypothetical protein [Aliiruegeria sabulilitoris]NDR57393.1 hypothetical protein [Pseudoruegeria sp. M32A2M]